MRSAPLIPPIPCAPRTSRESSSLVRARKTIAPEEIRDPHNLFVRFACELGVVGLLLAIAWLVAFLVQSTRPARLPADATEREDGIKPIGWIAGLATLLVCICAIDFTQDASIEVLRRILYGVIFFATAVLLSAADLQKPRIDGRARPVMLTRCTRFALAKRVLFKPGLRYNRTSRAPRRADRAARELVRPGRILVGAWGLPEDLKLGRS